MATETVRSKTVPGNARYDVLFEPVAIGPVVAPNRFYAVPHATGHGWAQPMGAIALRAMKAEGGWGTVATQITEIGPDSDFANHPMERIWDDSDIPRHAAQVEAVKKHGSLTAVELGHGGARARNMTTGLPVIGPSHLPVLRPEVPVQARAMNRRDIRAFREAHKAAVRRAMQAGYDIIYVYAAHDLSILSHFLSPKLNQRSDEYGGAFDNRLRLLREVLEDSLEVASGTRAIALRFSVAEPDKAGGLSHEAEGRDVVEALAELPDLWDVNISGWPRDSRTARFSEEGFQLPFTDFVKSVTSKPVVGVGRFTSPDMMVSLVNKKRLDLIGAARPSIADPFLPTKILEDRLEDIRECIGCNICVSMDSYGLPVRCTQNPTISEEWRREWHPENPTISKQRQSYLIIGSGPAGLECALTLVKAGQKVTIAEGADEPGGRVTCESRLPGLASWARVRDYRLGQLNKNINAELFVSSHMSANDIVEFGADNVILATGAKWRRDGVGSTCFEPIFSPDDSVLSPDDVLSGKPTNQSATTYLVYDDDNFYMASALAEHLCKLGHQVIYITPQPTIACWTDNTLEQGDIIGRLKDLKVELHVNTSLMDNGAFEHSLTEEQLNFTGIPIVFVGARLPCDTLFAELERVLPAESLFQTGDCVAPGTIQSAVLSGHTVAKTILVNEKQLGTPKREQFIP